MRKLFALAGLAALAIGCTTITPGDEVPEAGGGGACRTEPLAGLVGRPATQQLGAEALRLSGARTLRWIRPGDMVTMDYRTDRLNVHLDANNRTERFACG
jgi:hypothetical protein